MCTSPQVITLLPLLCRTPACISAHLNRASLNVHVSALCIISQPPHGIPAHTPVGMFTIWTSTNIRFGQKPTFLMLLLKAPGVAVSLGAPARPVWPLSIRLKDQLMAPTPGREFRQHLPEPFLRTHRAHSGQNHPSC